MAVTADYLDSLDKDDLPDLEDAGRRDFAGIVQWHDGWWAGYMK